MTPRVLSIKGGSLMKIRVTRDHTHKEHTMQHLIERNQYLARKTESAIISRSSQASVSVHDNGEINLSSGLYAQYKLSKSQGTSQEITLKSITDTNRKVLNANEVIVNQHKLNPRLYEWTDMREINGNTIIGDLTMNGTVLVKAWEPDLEKYVLIRRKTRQPLFGAELNYAQIPKEFDLES